MLKKQAKEESRAPGQERWLVTYSDLITLLMIFFIMMYSMSQIDANKFKAIAESLKVTFGGGETMELNESPSGPSIIEKGSSEQDPQSLPQNSEQTAQSIAQETMTIEGIKSKLDQFAQENGIESMLVSTIEERGLVVSIQDTLLFASGSDEITPTARTILKKVSSVLSAAPNYIRIEGHTDNLPIHTAKFPSNWELSVLRATNVLQILVSQGINAERLSAVGYGEYRPIADNNTVSGRNANRRVDLVILKQKYDPVEPGSN